MTEIRYAEEKDRDFWFRLDGHLAESEFMQKVARRQGWVMARGLPLPQAAARPRCGW